MVNVLMFINLEYIHLSYGHQFISLVYIYYSKPNKLVISCRVLSTIVLTIILVTTIRYIYDYNYIHHTKHVFQGHK